MQKFDPRNERFIYELEDASSFIAQNGALLRNCTFQEIDFTQLDMDWTAFRIENITFLGCKMLMKDELVLHEKGAYIYKAPPSLPYNPFRHALYTWQELMEGYHPKNDQSIDLKIYQHFYDTKFNPTINEALWQRIHDHAMDDSLRELLEYDDQGMTKKKCVGFMGGHSTKRTDSYYMKTALSAKLLAENDYFIVSGGGPGIMEATNLGAYFAGKPHEDLLKAIGILQQAPHYTNKDFNQKALDVLEEFPEGNESLAIPTWFYGHEPSNLFASHIAKYFSNSIREDTLLAISLYGIVCAPGSAGTTQEIFMDATQNHYGTFNYYSPMVFLGHKRYEIDTLIFPLLKQLSWGKEYSKLLFLTDEPTEILAWLNQHPPIPIE